MFYVFVRRVGKGYMRQYVSLYVCYLIKLSSLPNALHIVFLLSTTCILLHIFARLI